LPSTQTPLPLQSVGQDGAKGREEAEEEEEAV
jgi:hypothetical protein